jgi:prolyl oligopeptidase
MSDDRSAADPLADATGFAGVATVAAIVAGFVLGDVVTPPPDYPAARRDTVVDEYHGQAVADPYRWMESLDDPALAGWIDAQNRLTDGLIATLPGRDAFAARLRALLDVRRIGVPVQVPGLYAYRFNPGLAETDALWLTTDPAEPGRVAIDPLDLRADGTISLGDFALSPDGAVLAYSLSDGGSDWRTWHLQRTGDGGELPDTIAGTRFTGVSFSADGSALFYSRYPRRADGSYDDTQPVAVYRHRVGAPKDRDETVYRLPDEPTRNPYATVTEDGRLLVIVVQDGYETNALHYARVAPDGSLQGDVARLLDAWDARYEFVGNRGDELFVLTTKDAPRGRIIAIDLARPAPDQWREVVPQWEGTIEAAALVGGRLVVASVLAARSVLRVHPPDGGPGEDVVLPGDGTVAGLAGRSNEPSAWFSYTDFVTPPTLFRLDVQSRRLTAVRPPPQAVDASGFVVDRVEYPSRDGTRIPMTIVRRADLPASQPRPTVLYGYGGFNVSLLPAWSAARMAWIEAGGTYAQANLRGGGEFGEAWHRAGTRLDKQNVFDDFIAAAEWLIRRGYTTPRQLAIWGGSNGGLLVGAVLNQRPDLFAAAVPAVGVMDMLRYHMASLNARQWSSDYGLSENPDQFTVLRAYSPYHNLRSGFCYPPVLVQADANDDRVAPWHSYKYAAALQAAVGASPGCVSPALIRIETRSGHGAGASVSKTVAEYADQWTFVAAAIGLRR